MDPTTREDTTVRADSTFREHGTPRVPASVISSAGTAPGEQAYPSVEGTFLVRNLGRIALSIYLVVLVIYITRKGLPTDRIDQTIWILIGIVAAKLGQPWRLHVRAVLDWTPLLAALLVYDYTRGVADTLGMPIRVAELVDAERLLFGGTVPTVWLQERFYVAGETRWYDVVAGVTYMSHFVVPWALAAAFYMVARDRWWRYIRMVLLLSYAGLLTYVMVPAAPPWYASRAGIITDEVHRNAAAGWWDVISPHLSLEFAAQWFSRQQAAVNDVAALPSLHAGFALLVSVALWPVAKHWALRVPLVVFPIAMAFTLVYGGEHYVVDVLLGWTYVVAIMVGLRWWDRWWCGEGQSEARAEDRARPEEWSGQASDGAAAAANGHAGGNGHAGDAGNMAVAGNAAVRPASGNGHGYGGGNGHVAELDDPGPSGSSAATGYRGRAS